MTVEASEPDGSDGGSELGAMGAADIRRMLAAGEVIQDCCRLLREAGRNIVGEVLRGRGEFCELNHYPDDDVFDRDTHSQYYYHAHRGMPGEHGHFHTFLRAPGMPKDIEPIVVRASAPWPSGDQALSHLVGISMNAWGYPIGLFTTNRWVTDEAWYKADDVIRLLGRFRIGHSAPSAPVNLWISAMFVLFRPQMEALIRGRDVRVAEWSARHPGHDVFEDRALEITSQMSISVDRRVARLRALAGRSVDRGRRAASWMPIGVSPNERP